MLATTRQISVVRPRLRIPFLHPARGAGLGRPGTCLPGEFSEPSILGPQVLNKPVSQYLLHEMPQLLPVLRPDELFAGGLEDLHKLQMLPPMGYEFRVIPLLH